jgi:hypothetical protein
MSSDDISFQKHFKTVIIIFHSDIWVTTLTIKICTSNCLEQIKRCSKMLSQVIRTACVSKRCTTCHITIPSHCNCILYMYPVTHEHERTHLRVTWYVMMTNFFYRPKWDNMWNGVHMFESTLCTSCMQMPLCW